MNLDGYLFMVDAAAKFFNTLRISGWFHHESDTLRSVAFSGQPVVAAVSEVGVAHGGVLNLGPDKGFTLQVLRAEEALAEDAAITFTTHSGWSATIPIAALCEDRTGLYPGHAMMRRFIDAVDAMPDAHVLDIGGRARSQLDRSQAFGRARVSVLDIHPGDNVDIVADAHDMSAIPGESFDAVYSVSVFEHLMMPWAVVPQLHRVLKPGGLALIATHQTIGMHDMPWDFWRFSDTAWDALFNARTGFEIVERILESEQFIIPFIYRPIKAWAERAAGYEGTAVLVRKTGPCSLAWPVTPADLTTTMYPAGTEDPYEKK
ncbi:MAG: class I SAM-dependent methyltransferase [Alphaproteobacteria bacterium]|nr:class I SAM-dependent methyltransferase [Alphaproteobacteria bacterium]